MTYAKVFLYLPSSSFLVKALLLVSTPFAILLAAYFFLVPNVLKDPRRRKLPPGPKGLPFVGNMFDLADTEQVRGKVIDWHKKYGDLFYTKIGGTDFVWLSSPKVVKDLMDKRSSVYSSRSPAPLAQDVASAGRRQLFMPYGPRWRSIRKHSHTLLNLTASVKYQPVQDFESKQLLTEFLDSPENFYHQNRRYSASVIMLVTYGYRIPSWEDPLITKIYNIIDNFTDMT
jgi:cytochrome P450